ncbi:ferric uptake regulator, Fur family [Alkaliphilus metalliredigens QYMF]|uniref:Ferric uptake regulator, Fur family n=1 Tax=Alkaliphilus metalliredigens (strain QYMF) TaxID=293826 RepID=A6TU67_ALKMQ|nr:Fur family transcriptional regulator [Alkaliphilus metalliredigens]ABR49735.1 ferric uptake regulator, Fur family [Alkaliphilus metalliredigens QYMF]
MEVLVKTLKSKGCKITPQRLAVFQALKKRKDHPNAESIYKDLEAAYPTMSLATIYKSLELFIDLGLIQVINVGENSFRYDGNNEVHSHLICSQCARVEDLDNSIFQNSIPSVQEISNYKVEKQQFCFYGHCPTCQ